MLQETSVKSVLNKTKRRDPWFLDDYTLNPYSGCSFNCLYCYIRGSKYGINMEETLSVKVNAPDLLEKQLKSRAKRGLYGMIVLSSATDPYLYAEKKYELTRRMLEIILRYRFPVHMITKSDLIVRDFDLLKEINEMAILPDALTGLSHKALLTFSFSSLDDTISKIFEPGAVSPTRRLNAIQQSLEQGLYAGISLMPLIPYVTDIPEYLESMFKIFSAMKVNYIFPASMTLFGTGPSDSKPLMMEAIRKYFPHLVEKYDKMFSFGYGVPGWYNNMLLKRTDALCEKYKIRNRIFLVQ